MYKTIIIWLLSVLCAVSEVLWAEDEIQLTAEKIETLKEEAAKGAAEAQHMLGAIYLLGVGVPQDEKLGIELLEKSAAQGFVGAYNILGVAYMKGKGVELNPQKSLQMFQVAAEKGDVTAQFNMGVLYMSELPEEERDARMAKEWLSKAATQGHAKAMMVLGDLYLSEKGGERSDAEAAKWYEKALASGSAEAFPYNLGLMYLKGRGVKLDVHRALEIFAKGVEVEDVSSIYMLAVAHDKGFGVVPDVALARKLYAIAGARGIEKAYLDLALTYIKCDGDVETALQWMQKAADDGVEEMQQFLRMLRQ